jgi:hypothetical protein
MDDNKLAKAVRVLDIKDLISLGTMLVVVTAFGVSTTSRQDLTNEKLDNLTTNITEKNQAYDKNFDTLFKKEGENSDNIIRLKSRLGLSFDITAPLIPPALTLNTNANTSAEIKQETVTPSPTIASNPTLSPTPSSSKVPEITIVPTISPNLQHILPNVLSFFGI